MPVIAAAPVTQLVAGWNHAAVATGDGTVWTWGDNTRGQLGDGTTTWSLNPVQVPDLTDVIAVSAGFLYTLALKSDGTVWGWGLNDSGQLGDGSKTDRHYAVQVEGLTDVTAIAAGSGSSLAMKSDGTVWQWGYRYNTPAAEYLLTPTQVAGISDAIAVNGYGCGFALASNHTLWRWGYNAVGELGDGTTDPRIDPTQTPAISDVAAVASRYGHTVARKTDGTVWAWGYNTKGQVGDGTSGASRLSPIQVPDLANAIGVAAGQYHTAAVKADGSVWTWGSNTMGELGNGTQTESHVPVRVSGLSNAVAVAAGDRFTVALASDGFLWAWGIGGNGQLGDGSQQTCLTPARVTKLGPPIASIGAPSATAAAAGPLSYAVSYENATSITLAPADITLIKTGTANGVVSVTGSGTDSRTVTISGITGNGALGISIAKDTGSNAAGYAAAPGPSATFIVDNTPPTKTVVGKVSLVDSTTVHASWTASDAESGIGAYSAALSTTSGASGMLPGSTWQILGPQASGNLTGLSVTDGATYYLIARARNGAGTWGEVGASAAFKFIKPPDKVVVTPADQSLRLKDKLQYTATVLGSDKTVLLGRKLAWSLGSKDAGTISSGGRLTVGTKAGEFDVIALVVGTQVSGETNVYVDPGPASKLVVLPATASLVCGGTQRFTASAADSYGNPITSVDPEWSATSKAGTIGGDGSFTAGPTPGKYTNAIAAKSGKFKGTATVTVTAPPPAQVKLFIKSVEATSPLNVKAGSKTTLVAYGYDGLGRAISGLKFRYTADAAIGTVSSSGAFTASKLQPRSGTVTAQALISGAPAGAVRSLTVNVGQ